MCNHDLADIDTACADDYCPICLLSYVKELEKAIIKHKNKKEYSLHNGKLYFSEYDKELYKVLEEE